MIPVKTPLGQQVLKDRSVKLTPRQRTALILIDGKQTVPELLQANGAAGISRDDVDRLFELQLVAAHAAADAAKQAEAAPRRSDKDRYAAAYPIASQLAASLGLRGVRLSMAVEAAMTLDELIAVTVKIREAVGKEKVAPLEAALGLR